MGRIHWSLGAAAMVGALAWRRRRAELEGEVVWVTGASRGLGLLIARELAERGCRLVICARDPEQVESARRDLVGRGAEVLAEPCDLGDASAVARLASSARARFGRIDALVNNAAVIQVGPVEVMTLEDFRQAMASGFWGAVHATLEVLPEMRRRGHGRILNVTSIGGVVAVPHLLPYDCAKFATVGFSQGLRAELAGTGIHVTTVVPGLMRTGSPVNALFKGQRAREFTWFALGDALRLSSMDAARAARRIVLALERREGFVTLTWQAKLLRLTAALAPGISAAGLGAMNRLLPDPGAGAGHVVRGMRLSTPLAPSFLTRHMNRAALDTNQFGGRPRPTAEHARRIRG